MMKDITAVVPFCSYDEKFFRPCIGNLLSIGIRCIVTVYDHLYAGEPEDMLLLQKLLNTFKGNPLFSHMAFKWEPGYSSGHWEEQARYAATKEVKTEYVLYIDIDEIIEPLAMLQWLETGKYKKYTGIRFKQYNYFIEPTYRVSDRTYNTVMCRTDYALSLGITGKYRYQYFNNDNTLSRWFSKLGLNRKFYFYRGKPFIHHYTWAREKNVMIKKVTNWLHNKDRDDWTQVVEDSLKIKGNRIAGSKFKIVNNYFNI